MKLLKSAALAVGLLFIAEATAFAQAGTAVNGPFSELRGIGIGLVIIGAAYGIGRLTSSALESMARQPEIAANIQTAMIISAALIEGVTFFALIIIGFMLGNVPK
jgi:F-type H+-transporting ATPase subunit c